MFTHYIFLSSFSLKHSSELGSTEVDIPATYPYPDRPNDTGGPCQFCTLTATNGHVIESRKFKSPPLLLLIKIGRVIYNAHETPTTPLVKVDTDIEVNEGLDLADLIHDKNSLNSSEIFKYSKYRIGY